MENPIHPLGSSNFCREIHQQHAEHGEHKEPLRRISKACLPCRRDHLSCDNQRPCNRCQSKKGRECVEAESKPRGPKRKRTMEGQSISPSSSISTFDNWECSKFWQDFQKQFSEGECLSFLECYLGENDQKEEDESEEEGEPFLDTLASPSEQFYNAELKVGVKLVKEICNKINARISKVRECANSYQKRQLRLEFERELQEIKSSSSKLHIPVIVFGRGARILHYNEAFKDTTGFQFETPTPKEEYWNIVKIFDDQSIVDIHNTDFLPRLYLQDCKGIPMRLGFKSPLKGNVVGSAIITPLKHIMGFPNLFVCHFIPTPSSAK